MQRAQAGGSALSRASRGVPKASPAKSGGKLVSFFLHRYPLRKTWLSRPELTFSRLLKSVRFCEQRQGSVNLFSANIPKPQEQSREYVAT